MSKNTRLTMLGCSVALALAAASTAQADPYADAVAEDGIKHASCTTGTAPNDVGCLAAGSGNPVTALLGPANGTTQSLGQLGTVTIRFQNNLCAVDNDPSTFELKVVEGGGIQSEDFSVKAGLVGELLSTTKVDSIVSSNVPERMFDLTALVGPGIVDRIQIIDINSAADASTDAATFQRVWGADIDAIECLTPIDPPYLDVKPQSFPNAVNICSNGVIPIAIAGSELLPLDGYTVKSVSIGDEVLETFGKAGKDNCAFEDVVTSGQDIEGFNPDGYGDYVCHIPAVTFRDAGVDESVLTVIVTLTNGISDVVFELDGSLKQTKLNCL